MPEKLASHLNQNTSLAAAINAIPTDDIRAVIYHYNDVSRYYDVLRH
jgi:hypothetical protein